MFVGAREGCRGPSRTERISDIGEWKCGRHGAPSQKIEPLISKSSSDGEYTTSDMRPFLYSVHVFGREVPVSLTCTAPLELFSLGFSNDVATKFMMRLVMKHDEFVMNSNTDLGGWKCWKCRKLAVSLTHSPAMYLHSVCETSGPCDMEARQQFAGGTYTKIINHFG